MMNDITKAYIPSDLSGEYLLQDAQTFLFEQTYTKNNPDMLRFITEFVGKGTAIDSLVPPWGDDISVFSDYIIINFLKILLGFMGVRCHMNVRYCALFTETIEIARKWAKRISSDKLLILDVSENVSPVCKVEDLTLYLFQDPPNIIGELHVNHGFTIVK